MLDKEARGVRDGAEAESTGDPQSERRQREEPAGTEKWIETVGSGGRALGDGDVIVRLWDNQSHLKVSIE